MWRSGRKRKYPLNYVVPLPSSEDEEYVEPNEAREPHDGHQQEQLVHDANESGRNTLSQHDRHETNGEHGANNYPEPDAAGVDVNIVDDDHDPGVVDFRRDEVGVDPAPVQEDGNIVDDGHGGDDLDQDQQPEGIFFRGEDFRGEENVDNDDENTIGEHDDDENLSNNEDADGTKNNLRMTLFVYKFVL